MVVCKRDIAVDVFQTGEEDRGVSIMNAVSVGQRNFSSVCRSSLDEWIPAMEGVEDKLKEPKLLILVAVLEHPYANGRTISKFHHTAFDFHGPSIDEARKGLLKGSG